MYIKRVFFFFCLLLTSVYALADTIVLKKQHPTQYVIVKGDTLWDIASRFLRDPWRWPDIWHVNPQIANPHLIYPGDIVVLTYKNGRPQLELRRGGQAGRRVVKLSPQIRQTSIAQAIPSIPLDAIQQFLSRPSVVSEKILKTAPYIVASLDEHLIAGQNDKIYARGIIPNSHNQFTIVRPGKAYLNPNNKKDILGYEAVYIGESIVKKYGDPTTLYVAQSSREILIGDRLIPTSNKPLGFNFTPHPPSNPVNGQIISVIDGVSRIGQYQVVAVNLGTEHGMERGHILAVYQTGKMVRDIIGENRSKTVKLPDEKSGYLMVFRAFNRLSYALVMEANRAMRVFDPVTNP